MEEQNNQKKRAAEEAVHLVEDGMTLGLGTGSTVFYFLQALARRRGLNIRGVSTSGQTTRLASELGIPLVKLGDTGGLDLTIDGADEVDERMQGIKGGGGALLYEKIVASYSRYNVWIVDSGKRVKQLGKFPLPVEVVPFALRPVQELFRHKEWKPRLRLKGDTPFLTDSQNVILDLHLQSIPDPAALAGQLNAIPGVVEHGLFLGMTQRVIVGEENGVRTYTL
ncbi:ribose-5-phosphate isomerase A [Paenibacillus larvae subsp. larvae]|uniref:Ribose-5-phosphate isomerase A n=1 Tax=Paenibacillus larvae subsp. larvae TaxID=147375 RepID=A0A2L1UBE5_9BACL|nr:ribose-5-phosphate isomerase RpiA [Paenibacillus larvae]AVF25473.1 ribose-5-phosphate isomerase A [Paenibacillus larvae subsp. larvae]AVF30250.1 ribose-5-phosphate isomerase A [Paenibacillus larvae subsp. larvae]MBH0342939.1 hypothetical protein [Paenibacillus larvae]MCY7518639.1 ribose-5-phosphate isomerase RpiA [Paenibacillus larvae]MCY9501409.1 ribose-5-phosphate isomerase RpiA [Paenibacillus larvae]